MYAKTTLPIAPKKKEFVLLKPDQEQCTINLFEGNSPSVTQNQLLESFSIKDIPKSTSEHCLSVWITVSVTESNAITISAEVGGKSGNCVSAKVNYISAHSDSFQHQFKVQDLMTPVDDDLKFITTSSLQQEMQNQTAILAGKISTLY